MLADHAGTTSNVQDFSGLLVEASGLCVLGSHFGNFCRVRVTDSVVDSVVVLADVVVVSCSHFWCVSIALFNFLDVLRLQVLDLEVESISRDGVFIES